MKQSLGWFRPTTICRQAGGQAGTLLPRVPGITSAFLVHIRAAHSIILCDTMHLQLHLENTLCSCISQPCVFVTQIPFVAVTMLHWEMKTDRDMFSPGTTCLRSAWLSIQPFLALPREPYSPKHFSTHQMTPKSAGMTSLFTTLSVWLGSHATLALV